MKLGEIIELPPFEGLPPSPNQAGSGQHWSKGYKSKQEWQAYVAGVAVRYMRTHGLRGLMERAHIHIHISVGDGRRHDPDNLIWAVSKPTLDGLKGTIIEDDDIDKIEVVYTFDRAKPRGFVVTCKEILGEDADLPKAVMEEAFGILEEAGRIKRLSGNRYVIEWEYGVPD